MSSDEFESIARSSASPIDIVFNDDLKTNPPLHNILIRVIAVFCDRILAAKIVFGLICFLLIPATYLAAKKWFGIPAALATAFLTAANPMLMDFGAHIRGYGLAWLFLMLALYFYHDVIHNHSGHTLFILCSAIAVYAHYLSGLIFFIQFLFIAGTLFRQGRLFHFLTASSITLPAILFMMFGPSYSLPFYTPLPLNHLRDFIGLIGVRFYDAAGLIPGIAILVSVLLFSNKKSLAFPAIYIPALGVLLLGGIFFFLRHCYAMFFPPYFWMAFFGSAFNRKGSFFRIFAAVVFLVLLKNSFDIYTGRQRVQEQADRESARVISTLNNMHADTVYAAPENAALHLFGTCIHDVPMSTIRLMTAPHQNPRVFSDPRCRIKIVNLNEPPPSIEEKRPVYFVLFPEFAEQDQWKQFLQKNSCRSLETGRFYISYHCEHP